MGKIIKKKINGMSWLARTRLVLLLTLVTSVFMYQGWYLPKDSQAVVANSTQWAILGSSTTTVATLPAMTIAKPVATNRLLLVTVLGDGAANTGSFSPTVTYGGQAVTRITSSPTSVRQMLWIGYLNDAGITAATNTTLTVAEAGGLATTGASVSAAIYNGAAQTAPTAFRSAASDTAATSPTAGSVNVTNGGWVLYALNTNNTTAATVTAPTGQTNHFSTVNGTLYQFTIGSKAVTATAIDASLPSWTSVRYAYSTVAIEPSPTATGGTLAVSTATQTVAEAVGNATVSVTRTGGSTGAVSISYATADGTALAGQDYTATSGTLNWADGDTTAKTISIPIINDTYDEGATSEQFTVTLSTPTNGAALGTATQTLSITDDDATPTIGFSATSSSGSKATTPATFTVSLSAVSGLATSVIYATANGSASAGTDYTATSGTLNIPALSPSGTISVPISATSAGGTFTVTISSLTNATLSAGFTTHTYTITSAPPTTITQCGGCHGHPAGPNALTDSATRSITAFQGSHVKHVADAASCATCHINPARMDHSDGVINVNASISGGSYTGGTSVALDPTVSRLSTTYGTCSGTSCHAAVYSTAAGTSPNWTAAGGGCSACHNAFPITASGPATGSHASHAGAVCTSCHSAGTTATTAPTTLHGDGSINVTVGSYPVTAKHAANSGYSTCTAIYCHSSGTGGTGQTGDVRALGAPKTVPTWGTTLGCNGCHGNVATDGRPEYASGTPKMNDHLVGPHLAKTCDFCHDSVTYNAGVYTPVALLHNNQTYNVKSAMGYTYNAGGGSCATSGCHGNAQWGVTVLDCISCHTSPLTIATGPLTGGTRAAVALSLKTSGTRNHKSTTVGSDATKFDCIVCHMEGDSVTGSTSAQHANGVLDFRDPDTGTQVMKVAWSGGAALGNSTGGYIQTLTNFTTARFSRNLSQTLDADPAWLKVASIQMNLCLKCHDADGAIGGVLSKTAAGASNGATALRPFGNTTVASTATTYQVTATANSAAGNTAGSVMNVAASFETTNASYHPVSGRQNNSYVSGTRIRAPWNTARTNGVTNQYGYMLSCFDCHAAPGAPGLQTSSVVAHGNGSTIATPVLISNITAWTAGATNICNNCHAGYTTSTSTHSAGSAWEVNGKSHNTGVCAQCHTSSVNAVGVRAVDAHGFNVMNGGTTTTNTYGTRPYSFIRAPVNMGNWRPGTCASTSGCTTTGTYTPGGVY